MSTDPTPDLPVVARFEIRRRRYVDESGAAVRRLPPWLSGPRPVVRMYRAMVLARILDAKCAALNRQGRLGTYAAAYGQEAVPVGVASAMRADDVFVPSYRENAALLWRGVDIHEVLLYYAGSERGSDWAGPAHDFPTSITVGGHAVHAAGAAFARPSTGGSRAPWRACSETPRPRRATCTRRSTSPGSGACRRCSSSPTTSGGSRPRSRGRPRARPSRRRGWRRASRSSRPTATTWSRCTRRCASGSTARARAAARPSSRR